MFASRLEKVSGRVRVNIRLQKVKASGSDSRQSGSDSRQVEKVKAVKAVKAVKGERMEKSGSGSRMETDLHAGGKVWLWFQKVKAVKEWKSLALVPEVKAGESGESGESKSDKQTLSRNVVLVESVSPWTT